MDMAPGAISSTGVQDPSSASYQRSPLPLSAAQEAQVKDIYYKRVRGHCAREIRGRSRFYFPLPTYDNYRLHQPRSSPLTGFSEFAECAVGRTISATWICRDQRLSMNSCMVAHATRAEEDAAREEWFSSREERRKKREAEAAAVERRRDEVIHLIRKEEEREEIAKTKAPIVSGTAESSKIWRR